MIPRQLLAGIEEVEIKENNVITIMPTEQMNSDKMGQVRRWEKKRLWMVRLWAFILDIKNTADYFALYLDNEFLIGYFFKNYMLIISHNIIT
ncbi:MAG: hypothetical protein OXG87_03100 [Gemmatimonadetes bacterium]|nr:hypothetical protein [Gemmatimonadota bacterium]